MSSRLTARRYAKALLQIGEGALQVGPQVEATGLGHHREEVADGLAHCCSR